MLKLMLDLSPILIRIRHNWGSWRIDWGFRFLNRLYRTRRWWRCWVRILLKIRIIHCLLCIRTWPTLIRNTCGCPIRRSRPSGKPSFECLHSEVHKVWTLNWWFKAIAPFRASVAAAAVDFDGLSRLHAGRPGETSRIGQIISQVTSNWLVSTSLSSLCDFQRVITDGYFGYLWHRCYLRLGQWQESLQGINEQSVPAVLQYYAAATEHDSTWLNHHRLLCYQWIHCVHELLQVQSVAFVGLHELRGGAVLQTPGPEQQQQQQQLDPIGGGRLHQPRTGTLHLIKLN